MLDGSASRQITSSGRVSLERKAKCYVRFWEGDFIIDRGRGGIKTNFLGEVASDLSYKRCMRLQQVRKRQGVQSWGAAWRNTKVGCDRMGSSLVWLVEWNNMKCDGGQVMEDLECQGKEELIWYVREWLKVFEQRSEMTKHRVVARIN